MIGFKGLRNLTCVLLTMASSLALGDPPNGRFFPTTLAKTVTLTLPNRCYVELTSSKRSNLRFSDVSNGSGYIQFKFTHNSSSSGAQATVRFHVQSDLELFNGESLDRLFNIRTSAGSPFGGGFGSGDTTTSNTFNIASGVSYEDVELIMHASKKSVVHAGSNIKSKIIAELTCP